MGEVIADAPESLAGEADRSPRHGPASTATGGPLQAASESVRMEGEYRRTPALFIDHAALRRLLVWLGCTPILRPCAMLPRVNR